MIKDFLEELESESDASPSERGALQSFLQRHGFTSIYSARQVNCRVVRVDARLVFLGVPGMEDQHLRFDMA